MSARNLAYPCLPGLPMEFDGCCNQRVMHPRSKEGGSTSQTKKTPQTAVVCISKSEASNRTRVAMPQVCPGGGLGVFDNMTQNNGRMEFSKCNSTDGVEPQGPKQT